MDEYSNVNEITFRDYVRVLFRHKAVIFTTIITIMVTAVVGVLLRTPVYEAQVKMLISGQKHTQAEYYTDLGLGGLRSEQITLTQSEIVSSDPVLERVVSVLGLAQKPFDYEKRFSSKLKKPLVGIQANNIQKKINKLSKEQKEAFLFRLAVEDLRARLKVVPVRDTDLFLIKVTDFNPLGATVMANVVSRSYIIFDLEQQLAEMQLKYGDKHSAVIQLKEAIEKMNNGLNGEILPPIDAIGPASVKIIDQAKVPLRPAGISRSLTIILAFFISIFLGVMLAFSFEYMDQTFKSPREVKSFLGIKYLGSLPMNAKEDDYRDLSERLQLIIKNKEAKSILFTSVMPNEGVTSIVANLGKYIAENLGKKVLLIDGNFRKPILHKVFGRTETNNLINIIEQKILMNHGINGISQRLDIITSGPSTEPVSGKMKKFFALFKRKSVFQPSLFNPITALESNTMKDLIKHVKENYDFVLIDSPPLAEVRDAAIISALTDGVIVIVNERKTRRHVVKYALESLKARRANVFGMVFNNRRYVIPKAIYDRV